MLIADVLIRCDAAVWCAGALVWCSGVVECFVGMVWANGGIPIKYARKT
jgi:hypothetical protein